MSHGINNHSDYKFEQYIKDLLSEDSIGDLFNNIQKTMKRMSPNSGLFDGPGFVTNKYSSDKNYYPAVRKTAGITNRDMQNAEQLLYENISKLRKKGEKLYDPGTPIPADLTRYVTNSFSHDYVARVIKEFDESIENIKRILKHTQELPSNKLKKLLEAIDNFSDKNYTELSNGRSDSKYNILFKAVKDYMREINNINNVSAASTSIKLSFLMRGYIANAVKEFKEILERWSILLKGGLSSANAVVDDIPPIVGYMNKEGKIYRDLWDDFLVDILNATIGASQRGWSSGPNLYNILIGGQESKYTGRSGLKYKKVQTIEPKFMKHIHEHIMVPLFITPRILIYATKEQWDDITEGGRVYKTLTGLGKQILSAGENAPKVSL